MCGLDNKKEFWYSCVMSNIAQDAKRPIRSFKPAVVKPFKQLTFRGDGAQYVGDTEPTWPDEAAQREWTRAEYDSQLGMAFNWYTQTQEDKMATSLAFVALKLSGHFPELIVALENSTETLGKTAGWLIRMAHNGMVLRFHERRYLHRIIKKMIDNQKPIEEPTEKVASDKPTIQDHLSAKIRKVKGEMDWLLDQVILGKKDDKQQSVLELLNTPENTIPNTRTKELIEYCNMYLKEFRDAYEGIVPWDKAYCYGKRKLKAGIDWLEQAIVDITIYSQHKQSTRKARAKKAKSPTQLVGKLKYMREFPALKLKSVEVTKVLTSSELWVYNTRLRKLGRYVALNGMSFEVRGTKLANLDPTKSVQKTLRKPDEQLKEFDNYSKPGAVKWFNNIRAVATPLREALSNDSILLKAIK